MDKHDNDLLSRAEFWQRAATFGFAAWAIVLPLAAGLVVQSLSKFSESFNAYVLAMERRVTLLEERQSRILSIIEDQNERLRRLEGNNK